MQPSKRSSSKEEIAQEVPTKITSQHFMFPQVCFLCETYEKMKKKTICSLKFASCDKHMRR